MMGPMQRVNVDITSLMLADLDQRGGGLSSNQQKDPHMQNELVWGTGEAEEATALSHLIAEGRR